MPPLPTENLSAYNRAHKLVDSTRENERLMQSLEIAKQDDNPFVGSVKILALGRTDGAVLAWWFKDVG